MSELIAPGVWRLSGTRGSNVYLLEAADGSLALIDTGFSASAPAIERAVAVLTPGRVPRWIALTHGHVDHAGAAAELRARWNAEVIVGLGDCAHTADGTHVLREPVGPSHWLRRPLYAIGRRAASLIASMATATVTPPEVVVDRPLIGTVEVWPGLLAIPTPGHTPGSYCYVDTARGVAFVGDLVISHDGSLTRSMRLANSDDAQYLHTLRQFAADAPEIGCAGHGTPITARFGAQLRELGALPRRSPLNPRALFTRARRLSRFARALTAVHGDAHDPMERAADERGGR